MSIEIEYYHKVSGEYPISDFIDNLPSKAQAKTMWTFELVESMGLSVGMPYVASMVGVKDLWEIRVSMQGNIYRYFVHDNGTGLIILHAFVKKDQKTPRKEIETAIGRMAK
jgi:phage-related protein